MSTLFGASMRARWAAIGAAIAVTLAGGAVGVVRATTSSGERAVFVSITPCRLFDTRADQHIGQRIAPIAAGETFTQQVRGTNGNCTIAADAVGVAMNVTVVNGSAPSFLTIWPADAAKPLASSLNWIPGAPPTPNKVDVRLSATGAISLFNNSGSVDVLADVVGYYVDHNHDDRYYTKEQIDTSLAGLPQAYGMAREDGSLRVKSPNVVRVDHTGVGHYCVVFTTPPSHIEAAVFSGAGSGAVMGENTNGQGGFDSCDTSQHGGLEVNIYNAAGTLTDARFTFVIP